MKQVIRFSLNNKFAIWIMTVIVIFAGLYSGLNMKMETLPDINVPVITVNTIYPGAAPEEVVEKITKPIERQTRNLEGVTAVSSTSMENFSMVIIEYDFDKDMSKATSEVKEAVASVQLPQGAQASEVSRISLNAFPVLSVSVASQSRSLEDLTEIVNTIVLPELQGLDGVASVQITGQHVNQVMLKFDQAKLQAAGLTEEIVTGIIQGSALKVPLGLFEMEGSEKTVVIDGNITTIDDLKAITLPVMPPAMPLQLQDVASIELVSKTESISRTNGLDAIGISITKAAEANTVDVVNRVKDHLAQLEKETADLILTTGFDQGQPIEDSVHTMLSKAMLGSLFAVLIILLFLRNLRSTIIAVVSIPLSILIALLLLHRMDITLNIMTLGAMTVAIGRVVDDSIVVIENIYRRMSLSEEKLKGKELVLSATREMFIPIAASTIVTIAVFLPLGLVSGPIGEIFMPFALTIVFALLASLLVAVTVVPMLAHQFFRKGITKESHIDKTSRLAAIYKRMLAWSLDHKLITFGLAIVLLLSSTLLVPLIGFSFIPEQEDKMMIATYNPAPGERMEDVQVIATDAERFFLDRDGVAYIQYSLGGQNPMNPGASKQALFFINYEDDIKNFSQEKRDAIDVLQQLGGQGEWKEQDFTGGALGGNTISLNVFGEDIEQLRPVVEQLMGVMEEQGDLINIESGISETYDQYRIVANQAVLSQYGLTAGQIVMALMPAREQQVLTTVYADNKEVNVYLDKESISFTDKASLEQVMISSPLGIQVALRDVASIVEEQSSNTITRRDDRIYTEVSGEATTNNIGKVSQELTKLVDEMDVPPTVKIEMGGVAEQMNEAFSQLGLAMLAAVAIVYLILVITFSGALTPFTILFSLPFTIIGGLLGLWIAGETISVTAMIGALMLIGIVVTNAIVLIDRVINKEREGLSVREALLEAAGTRLRPILMTAIATIGALLPLAFGFESDALISKGLGVTVIGGLTSSTLLTLIIVPIVYEFFSRFRRKNAQDE